MIGLLVVIVLIGVWFVDTNNKWLAQKELAKSEKTTKDTLPDEINNLESVTEDISEPSDTTPTKSAQASSIECMQAASETSQGDFERYKNALEECQ